MCHLCIAPNQNEQDVLTLHHAPVSRVCDGIDMRRHLMPFLPTIHLNNGFCIDGQVLVGVYHHTKQTGVCL